MPPAERAAAINMDFRVARSMRVVIARTTDAAPKVFGVLTPAACRHVGSSVTASRRVRCILHSAKDREETLPTDARGESPG